ncbi:MAG TPA: hypothetical protein PLP20_05510, partial [Oscillospiraceae bacterium]|nr:hypothetical protein [Oscillospiraceae bacterium]
TDAKARMVRQSISVPHRLFWAVRDLYFLENCEVNEMDAGSSSGTDVGRERSTEKAPFRLRRFS